MPKQKERSHKHKIQLILLMTIAMTLAGCWPQQPNTPPQFRLLPRRIVNSKRRPALVHQLKRCGVNVTELGDTLRIVIPSDRLFTQGSTRIDRTKVTRLITASNLIKTYGDAPITVVAYTDNIGTRQHRQAMSERMAHVVTSYLWAQGIPYNQITYFGGSSNQPIAANNNPVSSAHNRRIEITVNRPPQPYSLTHPE